MRARTPSPIMPRVKSAAAGCKADCRPAGRELCSAGLEVRCRVVSELRAMATRTVAETGSAANGLVIQSPDKVLKRTGEMDCRIGRGAATVTVRLWVVAEPAGAVILRALLHAVRSHGEKIHSCPAVCRCAERCSSKQETAHRFARRAAGATPHYP